MTTENPQPQVARDLTEIVRLHSLLPGQAFHKACDRLMPGGTAMVALAYAASVERFDQQLDTLERAAIDTAVAAGMDPSSLMPETYEDGSWETPLQTLLFWSERWRTAHDWPKSKRPDLAREANFIRYALDWAQENEPEWFAFTRDIARARARLENILYAGTRVVATGAPCMYDDCKGARLVRTTVPTRTESGEKGWRLTDWHCPRCKRSWDEDRYARLVTAARERSRYEDIDGIVWCDATYAARQTGRSYRTIQTWINRKELSTLCLLAGRRLPFVSLDEVRELAESRPSRRRKVSA